TAAAGQRAARGTWLRFGSAWAAPLAGAGLASAVADGRGESEHPPSRPSPAAAIRAIIQRRNISPPLGSRGALARLGGPALRHGDRLAAVAGGQGDEEVVVADAGIDAVVQEDHRPVAAQEV